MRTLLVLSLLSGTVMAQELKPVLIKPIKPVVDLKVTDKVIFRNPFKTVKVPYTVYLRSCEQAKPALGSCSLEYKGIVLARHKLEGRDTFTFKGTFALNEGVSAVQLHCQLDGYEPLLEPVELVNNTLKVEECYKTRKLFQEPRVDLDRGIARVRVQIPKFREEKVWLDGRSFVRLTSEHKEIFSNSWNGEPLLPEFPLASFYLALPLDAKVTRLMVKPGQVVGGLNLPLLPKAEEGEAQFDGPVPPRFDKEAYFSGPAEISLESSTRFEQITDREQNLVKVSLPLVDYFAQQSTLRYYDDVEITLSFKADSRCFRAPYKGRDAVDVYRAQQLLGLNQLILNPEDVLNVCRSSGELRRYEPERQLMRAAISTTGPNLVIVSPASFEAEAERLRLHKETLGVRTGIIYWEGGSASELKEKLNEAAAGLRPNFMQWVLLLGDVDRIPTYYDEAMGDPRHGDYALSAGDVYYTQFPENQQDYTPSMDPKFSIGRIPAKSVQELKRVVDRIMQYENNPPTVDSYYSSPTIAATMQMTNSLDTGSVNNYAEFMENSMAQRYFQAGFRPERIFRTDTEVALKPRNWSPSKPIDYGTLTLANPGVPSLLFHMEGSQALIDGAVKRGTNILINRGHATTRNWAWPGFSYDSARFSLFPTDKPPMVFAIACLTGFFDSETIHDGHITSERSELQTLDPKGRYLAEQMLLDANGALGVLASTRQSMWPYNNRLTLGLARSLIDRQGNVQSLSQRLGDVTVDAKVFAKKITGSLEESKFLEKTNRHHLLVYNLLGDPSVELRQALPLRVQGQPTVKYDAERQSLRVRFRVESLACPGCDLAEQKEQPIAVVMDANQRILHRAFASPIVGENGENREVTLSGISSFHGNLFHIYLSSAGLIPYHQVIDNRIR
jgi:hypothetical protein